MRTGDSRSKSGPGILPLRHEDFQSTPPFEISSVIGLLGYNVKSIENAPELRYKVAAPETIGNIMPMQVYLKETRPAPGHAPVWPAIVGDGLIAPAMQPGSRLTPSGGSTRGMGGNVNEASSQMVFQPPPRAGTTVALSTGATSDGAPYTMRPVINEGMNADARFQAAPFNVPLSDDGYKLWNRLPEGLYGVSLPATNEERQVNLFLPCDPRLIAVNQEDDPAYGSLVCDMDGDGGIDHHRMARLQSALRVVLRPQSTLVQFPDSNALAFQLSGTGNGDTVGGLFYDCWRGNAMGVGSILAGGFFDTGVLGDKHQLGEDGDGHAINSLHLSLQALFIDKFDATIDGPMHHEGYAQGAVEAPHRTKCHFVYDPAITYSWLGGGGGFSLGGRRLAGKQVWESTSFMYVPNTPTGGPPSQPPPTNPPPGTPNTPSGGGGGGNPGGGAPGGGNDPPICGTGATAGSVPGAGFGDPSDPTSGGSDKPIPLGDPSGNQLPWAPPRGGPKPVTPPQVGQPGRRGGEGGGGVIPVGPLPPGSDFPKWKNPDGSDPFGPFGIKPVNHGKHWAAQQAARAARRAARKARHAKGKVVGVVFKPPAAGGGVPVPKGPDKPKPKSKIIWGVDVPNVFHGRGDTGNHNGLFNIAHPAPPNVFTPNGGGSPTPASGLPTRGGPLPGPTRGPMPTGSFPVPVTPPGMTNELLLPSWLFRPQHYSRLAPDLRYDITPSGNAVRWHDRTAPVTGHLVAYGAQGGTVGGNPGDTQPNYWKYTQTPRTGKFWAGTAPGGLALVCPEVDLADGGALSPGGVTKSPVYLVATLGTYFGAGRPDLANGGIYTGWRWGADSSGNLTFSKINSSGASTFDLRFPNADGSSGQALVTDGTGHLSFGAAASMAAIFGQTADQTIGGTGAETSMIGTGTGAESVATWAVGKSVRVMLRGGITSKAITPGTIQVKGKVGGVTGLDTGAVNIVASLANSFLEVEMIVTCRDLTTPNAAVFAGQIFLKTTGATPITSYTIHDFSWTGAVDTTAATAIDVTFQWGTSDAGNTLTTVVGKIDTESPG